MYLRTKQDALEAVAEILALPERCQQIIQLTVKIMSCLASEARRFLTECMATLIENGLEYMRRKRQESLDELREQTPDALIVLDPSHDDLLEEAGSALDALRMAHVAMEVFPDLRRKVPSWRVARAVLHHESSVREALIQGVRLQAGSRSTDLAPALDELLRLIESSVPEWLESTPAIEALCNEALLNAEAPPHDSDVLFSVLAMSDDRVRLLLDLLATDRSGAIEYLSEVRRRIEMLQELHERETA